jgi:DNA (cytosine-5)-methyltransferase 1
MATKLKMLSLFSGIGGIDLAAEWTGQIETVAFCEIEPFCQRVLNKHWPSVPIFDDVRTLTKKSLSTRGITSVDIIAGGFPCQDISRAGNRIGINGERSGLWREMHRIVCDVRPRFVLVENVADLLARGLGDILTDLASTGFDAEWQVLSAAESGLPHLRERLFLVAYPCGTVTGLRWLKQLRTTEAVNWQEFLLSNGSGKSNGVSPKVDRLRGYGNAVVPQQVFPILKAITEIELSNS